MLPLIVTVCLSRGARAMASGKAIVRRLDAIETLGGMDVLCVDKTGTPTSGVIKLDRAQSMSGLNSSYVLHAAWLTTLIPHTTSNPWDDAIVAVEGDSANDTGDVQVEGGMPFDPIRRRATVIVAKSHHHADREHTGGSDISETSGAGAGTSGNVSRIMVVVKGAVSEMLPRCDTIMRNGTAEPLTDRRLHPLAQPRAHQTVARLDESGAIPSEPGDGCVIISKKTSAAPLSTAFAPTLKLPIIPISPSNCDNATAFYLIKWKRDLNLSNAQSAFEQQFVHEVLPMIFVLHSRSVSC